MKAILVTEHSDTVTVSDIPQPTPAPGEIAVRIFACGLNFADLLMLKGQYQDTPSLPFVLGMEVGGEILALGEGVTGLSIGDRIAVFGGQGGLAEVGCFPAERAVKIPDTMSFEDAAAFQIAYGTSHLALDHKARLQPGETLLVLGAAGGVGLTAVEIGKLMGARVVACARGAEKLEIARKAGADFLIDATKQDIREEMKALGGADVVYDPVGGDQFTAAFRSCRPEARILTIGFASGEVPQIKANHLLVKNISVLGLYWGGYLQFKPEILTNSLDKIINWYKNGYILPHISNILSLSDTGKGLDLLRSRASTGKVVIRVQDGD